MAMQCATKERAIYLWDEKREAFADFGGLGAYLGNNSFVRPRVGIVVGAGVVSRESAVRVHEFSALTRHAGFSLVVLRPFSGGNVPGVVWEVGRSGVTKINPQQQTQA